MIMQIGMLGSLEVRADDDTLTAYVDFRPVGRARRLTCKGEPRNVDVLILTGGRSVASTKTYCSEHSTHDWSVPWARSTMTRVPLLVPFSPSPTCGRTANGWTFGYSFGVCVHRIVLEGRGLNHVQAAQPGGNQTWYSGTFMSGPGEKRRFSSHVPGGPAAAHAVGVRYLNVILGSGSQRLRFR